MAITWGGRIGKNALRVSYTSTACRAKDARVFLLDQVGSQNRRELSSPGSFKNSMHEVYFEMGPQMKVRMKYTTKILETEEYSNPKMRMHLLGLWELHLERFRKAVNEEHVKNSQAHERHQHNGRTGSSKLLFLQRHHINNNIQTKLPL